MLVRRLLVGAFALVVLGVVGLSISAFRADAGRYYCIVLNRTNVTLNEMHPGATQIVNVRLNIAPPAYSTVIIYPDAIPAPADFTVSPASRQLNTSTWNTGRNFTFAVIDDLIDEIDPEVISYGFFGVLNVPHQSPITIYPCGRLNVSIHDND
jgi:hypothetical protein